jgi:hypothetical protein
MASASAPSFNPTAPEFIRDPYPYYSQLRREDPIHRAQFGWVATRARDIAFVLKDRRFGKDYLGSVLRMQGPTGRDEPAVRNLSLTMLMQNPPDHPRVRGMIVKAFTPNRVEGLRPRVRAIVSELLDRARDRGGMNVIAEFALPLPIIVISETLGIPSADHGLLAGLSNRFAPLVDAVPVTREQMADANDATRAMADYFSRLFWLRRDDPRDDLTTALVRVMDEERAIDEEQLIANIILLAVAGHETTANLIGNGLLSLARFPEQWSRLVEDRSLLPSAIEELLRFDSSVQMVSRTALEDMELGGKRIAAGENVIVVLGSANRDPDAFHDPDRLDVGRTDSRIFSFGGGIHTCLGAQLSRLEGEEALRGLLERHPALRIGDVDQPRWRPSFALRGLERLEATW